MLLDCAFRAVQNLVALTVELGFAVADPDRMTAYRQCRSPAAEKLHQSIPGVSMAELHVAVCGWFPLAVDAFLVEDIANEDAI